MRAILYLKKIITCHDTLLSFVIGGEPLLGQKVTKNISVYPKGLGGDKPAWVAFDRQVNSNHQTKIILSDILTF